MKTFLRSLTLIAITAITAITASAADKSAKITIQTGSSAALKIDAGKTISSIKSTLDASTEKVFMDAHKDILGKHQIVRHEKSGDKTCVLTSIGEHHYLAYVPNGSIDGISAIEYRWIPATGLLVMPLDKSGADMKDSAYFDFLISGFDPKTVSKHVTTSKSGGAIHVPLRTAMLGIGAQMPKVALK
jgi:hypothetical protein